MKSIFLYFLLYAQSVLACPGAKLYIENPGKESLFVRGVSATGQYTKVQGYNLKIPLYHWMVITYNEEAEQCIKSGDALAVRVEWGRVTFSGAIDYAKDLNGLNYTELRIGLGTNRKFTTWSYRKNLYEGEHFISLTHGENPLPCGESTGEPCSITFRISE